MKKRLISGIYIASLLSFTGVHAGAWPELKEVRSICHELTDSDIEFYKKYPMPKRKKAFARHIKQICERVELSYWLKKPLGPEQFYDLYQLELAQASMRQKAVEDVKGMTLVDKLKMGIDSVRSSISIRRKKDQGEQKIIRDSLFWNDLGDRDDRHKAFGDLAKDKKIKAKDDLVILFDEVSDSGSAPKIKAIDLNEEDEWSLKWGDELHSDVVGSRLFAALGFDVDHPYYRSKNDLTLVFTKKDQNAKKMLEQIKSQFKIDISKFVSESGVIDDIEINHNDKLSAYKGLNYIRFKEALLEARPDRVKRLGSIVPDKLSHENRVELKGALLAHLWIDNWDTREENTMLSNVHLGKKKYKFSGVFSDLGTSLGVAVNYMPMDFRVGLVNEFSWDIVKSSSQRGVSLKGQLNALLKPYRKAKYSDLKWMATQIAKINAHNLEKILEKSGWPEGIQKLYFHKLASRRAQILAAFDVSDPNPIKFDRKFSYSENGIEYIKDGVLIRDYDRDEHPLGYLNTSGRLRNYGEGK